MGAREYDGPERWACKISSGVFEGWRRKRQRKRSRQRKRTRKEEDEGGI